MPDPAKLPIQLATTSFVLAALVAADAAAVNVVRVRVDDFAIAHVVAPIGIPGTSYSLRPRIEYAVSRFEP